jgi:hypothetical protein
MTRGILFSAPMVRAILDGRKTQTRRIVTRQNSLVDGGPWYKSMAFDFQKAWVDPGPSLVGNRGPYLKAPLIGGDTIHRIYPRYLNHWDELWVRETYAFDAGGCIAYRATDESPPSGFIWGKNLWPPRWRPSLFMPRRFSRITLNILAVEVQRLQEITEEDAKAEGAEPVTPGQLTACSIGPHQYGFRILWDSINSKRAPFSSNPWVWKITFERTKP